MSPQRSGDYFQHILDAAKEVLTFIDGLDASAFQRDRKTQQAVIMNLLIIGEAATRLTNEYPALVETYSDIPWASMRGMRNRLAHGYFEINAEIVWETARSSIPELIHQVSAVAGILDAGSTSTGNP